MIYQPICRQMKFLICFKNSRWINNISFRNYNKYSNKSYNNSLFASTCAAKHIPDKKDNLMTRIVGKIPFVDVSKSRSQAVGYLLYETIVDGINYIDFFEKYDLPDTFYSWFVITELHAWMWAVRSMAEGNAGRHIRNYMFEALWADTSVRSKKLGASNPSATRIQINILSEQLQASLIAYDEGLQGRDTILAGALWRRLYQQGDVNPLHLDSLVKYIRKQMRILDNIPSTTLLSGKVINLEAGKVT